MVDYGQPLQFGYFLVPEAGTAMIQTAQEADRLGLDLIGIQDHPYQRRYVDTLALMGAVLSATTRIRVFPDVACLPLRPPATLAKTLASFDFMYRGRAELGLGAGAFWDAIEAFGGPRRTPGQARAALEEAIQVLRLLWTGMRSLRFDGAHYRLAGAQFGPVPAHAINIWLGVTGPKSLELAGAVADGWIPSSSYIPPTRLLECHEIIDDAAMAADREPTAVRRLYNVQGTIDDAASGFLQGPVKQWVDELTRLAVGHGIDTFIFGGVPSQLSIFAREVAPAVREQVAQERNAV
jgi:alkanesulfonate monooxygenase SsuD/methylene tetrahydromethanopterin reductase-like flavin-dependent oxidoreductase (luciferase family)